MKQETNLEPQLLVDDFQVTNGIDLAFDVSDLLVLKSSWKEKQVVTFKNYYPFFNLLSRQQDLQ